MSAISPTSTGRKATKLPIPISPAANTPAMVTPVMASKPAITNVFACGFKALALGLKLLLV